MRQPVAKSSLSLCPESKDLGLFLRPDLNTGFGERRLLFLCLGSEQEWTQYTLHNENNKYDSFPDDKKDRTFFPEHHTAHPTGEGDKVAVFPLFTLLLLLHIGEGEESLDIILIFPGFPHPGRLKICENNAGVWNKYLPLGRTPSGKLSWCLSSLRSRFICVCWLSSPAAPSCLLSTTGHFPLI